MTSLEWARDAAKALDAKPWLEIDGSDISCLFCARYVDFQHASDCRMRDLEALARTVPRELLE